MSWRVGLALFLFALVTRIPFGTANLYAPDSVLYERGMERFDPLDQRPQPPGYLWYILTLRTIDLFTHDPNRAMTMLSAVAGAVCIALVYLLAARLYEERTARVSAIFMLTAVTFWAYGGVAYPYTLLAALTTLCALLFWRVVGSERPRGERAAALILASATWGAAIGFRSDLAMFVAPLWLFAAAHTTLAAAGTAAVTVAALVATWIGASAAAGGGLDRFVDAVRMQGRFVEERYSVVGNGPMAIYRNSYELARFLGRGLYLLIPLVAAVVLSADARRVELRDRRRATFLGVWTFAPVPFFVLIHVGEYGYVFSMLPGLSILAARGAIALAKGLRMPRTLRWIVGGVALANAAIFLLSDTPLSARDIARHDRGIDEKVAFLSKTHRPADTFVITAYDAVLVDHYLRRQYPVLAYDPAATPSFTRALLCPTTTVSCARDDLDVVLWDDSLRAEGSGWVERRMPHGSRLRIARVPWGSALAVSDGLGIRIVR